MSSAIITSKPYYPKMFDRSNKIRKTVDEIRRLTHLDKTVIAERLMDYGVQNLYKVFPEISEKDNI